MSEHRIPAITALITMLPAMHRMHRTCAQPNKSEGTYFGWSVFLNGRIVRDQLTAKYVLQGMKSVVKTCP